jgi:SMODS-associated and fused to various effectors sensor domain
MSVSYIPDKTKILLWGKAAGRCEYDGCNKPLYQDPLTKCEFNQSYIAHIVADKPKGPRGDEIDSPLLQCELSNLMLLCDTHHRLVDKENVLGHDRERLEKMKANHEERIEILTSIQVENRSHVILYGANIGNHASPLNMKSVMPVMIPERYPTNIKPIEIGLKNHADTDKTSEYWTIEERNLVNLFNQKIAPIKGSEEVQHFSIFSFAPQPLLIKLGTLFSDIYEIDVYERQREPKQTWEWSETSEVKDFIFIEPMNIKGIPVLLFELSATITHDRIYEVIGQNCSIWIVKIDTPQRGFMKTKILLSKFRMLIRQVFDRIKAVHGQKSELHIFPAMPISLAIETGRVWMPKSDLPLIIYDQNAASEKGGFAKSIVIKHQ